MVEKLGITSTSVVRMKSGEQRIMPVTTLAVEYLETMESRKKGKRMRGLDRSFYAVPPGG